MKRILLYAVILAFFSTSVGIAQVIAPAAYGPTPSGNQMRVQEMESYAFVHFS